MSSRDVTFIERVESNTPSMVDDIDEESKSSDDFGNIYHGVPNLESTTLGNAEGSHGPVHQYNRMTLRSSRKRRDNLAEAKSLNSTLVGNLKSNQPKERDLTRGEPGPKAEQKGFEGRLSQQIRSLDIPTSIVESKRK